MLSAMKKPKKNGFWMCLPIRIMISIRINRIFMRNYRSCFRFIDLNLDRFLLLLHLRYIILFFPWRDSSSCLAREVPAALPVCSASFARLINWAAG